MKLWREAETSFFFLDISAAPRELRLSLIVNNFTLDTSMVPCYIYIKMNEKKESIFEVTFTNKSTVFIQAMDEGHARRIVERNGNTGTRADDSVEMVIEKIEL